MQDHLSVVAPSPVRRRPFRLTRYFLATSLVGVLLVMASLIWVYRDLAERQLVEHETRANTDLTTAFANVVWARYREFVIHSAGRSREALLADPVQQALREDVLAKMRNLRVAKVKIYNADGLTVFSTDARQVGEDKSGNPGFLDARAGRVGSLITFRARFDAFEGEISNRNLIGTYVPARSSPNAAPEAVFEVYSDVTELIASQRRALWQIVAAVLTALSALYLFLYGVVRKADRLIAAQDLERERREAQVRHQAYHDALTGLPNRAYFGERLVEALAQSDRRRRRGALLFIDLDRFKIVNDSLGHAAGDELLRAVAERIGGCLRTGDLLFRMGGDEFTVILGEIAAPEDAAQVARRIASAVARPLTVHGHELHAGASTGIAVFPDDGDTVEALLKNADAAMYSAKEAGRGTHSFYRLEMNRRALDRLGLETAVQRGYRDGEFTLYYQPRLASGSREVVALEALLRWASPTRGLVAPGEFIGVLEDSGMMPMVGEWVLRSACAQLMRWSAEGRPPLRVSVNVSPVQFRGEAFVAIVERVLRDTGAPPALLELELTESMLIDDVAKAAETIAELKSLGVSIAVDDFGTGFSSLAYLRHFSVDYLKIDRSIVCGIDTGPRDRLLAKGITELARALDIAVVAEGVETATQAEFLEGIACAELQGFLFARPVPPEQLGRFLGAATLRSTSAEPELARAG